MSDPAFTVRTVLVPIDFSDASIRALAYGKEIAKRFQAALRLAHVVPLSIPTFYAYPAPSLDSQKEREREIGEKLRSFVSDQEWEKLRCRCVVRTGHVDEELLETVERTRSDLVVMGSHGRRRFERWFVGGVAANMLRRVRVPILTVTHTENPPLLPFKKILAATDLSAAAGAGVNAAAVLAHAFNARLTALHVCERGEHDDAEIIQAIPAVAARMRIERVVIQGTPYEMIVRYAEEEGFDLIALTRQGGDFVHEALIGSTTDRLIRTTALPVLSVQGARSGRSR